MNHSKVLIPIVSLLAIVGVGASVVSHRKAQAYEQAAAEAEVVASNLYEKVTRLQQRDAAQPKTMPMDETHSFTIDDADAIQELEERLKAKDEELAMVYKRIADMEAASTNAAPRRNDRRGWMDDLKASDPERYNEIVERRENARAAAKYEVAKKAAFFLDRDTSSMDEQEAEAYATMMNLWTDTLALTEQLSADLPREERRPLMRAFRDNLRALSPMLDNERDLEFMQIGKDMGYSDQDAEAFAAYLNEVVEITSVGSIFRNSARAMGGWGERGRQSSEPARGE